MASPKGGDPSPATRDFLAWRAGDPEAAARLEPRVYDELRSLARAFFRQERPDQTLQPTALVHEAYLRLIDAQHVEIRDHAHFRALAAKSMRRVLRDHARRRRAAKRGGDLQRVTLAETPAGTGARSHDLQVLEEALQRLEQLDPRQHEVVELRYLAGLNVSEVAEVLGLSQATVEREWRAARAWLGVRLRERGVQ